MIEFDDIPEEPVEVRQASDQDKSYGWWPVAILEFKDAVYHENRFPETSSFVYCICIYQVVCDELYAWGMKTSRKMDFTGYKVHREGSIETNLARNTFLPFPMSIILCSAAHLVPPLSLLVLGLIPPGRDPNHCHSIYEGLLRRLGPS